MNSPKPEEIDSLYEDYDDLREQAYASAPTASGLNMLTGWSLSLGWLMLGALLFIVLPEPYRSVLLLLALTNIFCCLWSEYFIERSIDVTKARDALRTFVGFRRKRTFMAAFLITLIHVLCLALHVSR